MIQTEPSQKCHDNLSGLSDFHLLSQPPIPCPNDNQFLRWLSPNLISEFVIHNIVVFLVTSWSTKVISFHQISSCLYWRLAQCLPKTQCEKSALHTWTLVCQVYIMLLCNFTNFIFKTTPYLCEIYTSVLPVYGWHTVQLKSIRKIFILYNTMVYLYMCALQSI